MSEAAEPLQEVGRITEVRGVSLLLFRVDLRMAAGESAWMQILRECGPEVRDFLSRDPDPNEWIPVSWLAEARAIFHRHCFKKGTWSLRGEHMARHIITHARASGLLKEPGPEGAVLGYPAVFAFIHRGGRVEAALQGEGRGEIVIHVDYPYDEYPAQFLPSFFVAYLKLLGGRLVQVTYRPPASRAIDHRYGLSWK
jgi:hypothetical protein